MPVLDGYGVLQAVQNIPAAAAIPFIFLTSNAEMSDLRKAMNLGADDYLTKPYTGEALLNIVSARIRKSSLLKRTIEDNTYVMDTTITSEEEIHKVLLDTKPVKNYTKKTIVYSEGDTAGTLYYLRSGKLKIYRSNDYGKDYITDLLREGDFFGYTALLEDTDQKESVMALEHSEVVMIPKQDFFHYLNGDKTISMKFIRLLSRHLVEAEDKLIKLAYNSARKRVAEALLFASSKYKSSGDEAFTLNRENLSSLAGISPESVSRHLSDFKDEGLIENNAGTIRILDVQKLDKLKN
jgi:CRP-like cAMP-binding protein